MLAPVTAVADWLKGDAGITSALEVVSRLEGDEALAREPVAVFDFYRDEEAVSGDIRSLPALVVRPAGPALFDGEIATTFLDAQSVAVEVIYLTAGGGSPEAFREAAYTLAALDRSFSAFLADTEAGRAARERLGLAILAANRRTFGELSEQVGDVIRAGAYVVEFTLRNTEPI